MPDYLTVSDFLAYDAQMTRKIGRVNDNVDVVREQLAGLTSAFKSYVAETDAFRVQMNQRLATIEQTMNRGFALIFAQLGIQP